MNRAVFLILILILGSCAETADKKTTSSQTWEGNRAYTLGKISLEATARDTDRFKPRPTVTSRILGLIWTSVFDAWSVYDAKAVPVYFTGLERRPEAERTLENKEIAISYAAYRAMMEYYWADSAYLRQAMLEMGLNPDDNSEDPTSPVGIGNLAAKAVIEARKNDGANQYGDIEGSDGTAYSDYTGYQPVNTADKLTDINRWQPKYFSDGKGGQYAPGCLTPHWHKVKPLILESGDQLRPGPPPMVGSAQLAAEVKEVIDLQAGLTNEQKALVEFMRDGPKSVQQAGHWLIFAQKVSTRDQHTLDQDVQMYFLVAATAMDAFIAAWDSKMFYDFARPYALVHDYYQSQVIKAWGGPETGMTEMPANQWRPYSPETFLCPPFPSYVSGHSCVSGACSEALRMFTGSDIFGDSVRLAPGSMTEPAHVGDSVTLHFPTFTETANMAGISRVLGGYHIQADNIAGLELGRGVAGIVFDKFRKHTGQ
ncbi:MAG: vanadium-dependent haloperoxidase [Bacteroidia bacterium]|nr:vanadium-dependent haloperoxidase [Bacteroidia bacterium]